MNKPRPTDKVQGGYTLLELIVAMTVLALAMAIVAPRMAGSRDKMQLKAAAVALASDLRATRAAARRQNLETFVTLDVRHHAYTAQGLGPRRLPRAVVLNVNAPRSADAPPGSATFRFKPDGTASGGEIQLASGANRASINIDWLTGGVFLTWR